MPEDDITASVDLLPSLDPSVPSFVPSTLVSQALPLKDAGHTIRPADASCPVDRPAFEVLVPRRGNTAARGCIDSSPNEAQLAALDLSLPSGSSADSFSVPSLCYPDDESSDDESSAHSIVGVPSLCHPDDDSSSDESSAHSLDTDVPTGLVLGDLDGDTDPASGGVDGGVDFAAIVPRLTGPPSIRNASTGQRVVLKNLEDGPSNGLLGTLVAYRKKKNRWRVRLEGSWVGRDSLILSFRPCNLHLLPDTNSGPTTQQGAAIATPREGASLLDGAGAVVEESQPDCPVKRQYWDDQIHTKLNASHRLKLDNDKWPSENEWCDVAQEPAIPNSTV